MRGLRRRHSNLTQPNGNRRPSRSASQLIDVGNGDHERDRLAVELGDPDQILVDDRLQFLAGVGDFGLGQRDEPPIVRPGVVEQAEDDRGLARRSSLLSTLRMRMRGFFSPALTSRSISGDHVERGYRPRRCRGPWPWCSPRPRSRRDMRGGGGPSSPSAAGRSRRSAGPAHPRSKCEIGPSALVMPSSAQPFLGAGDQRRRRLAVERLEHAPLAEVRAPCGSAPDRRPGR